MVMRNDVRIRETRLFGAILKQKLSLIFSFCTKSALIDAKCLRTTCTRLAMKKPKLFKQVTSPYDFWGLWSSLLGDRVLHFCKTVVFRNYHATAKTQWKVQLPHLTPPNTHSPPLPTPHPTVPLNTLHSQWCFDFLSVRPSCNTESYPITR